MNGKGDRNRSLTQAYRDGWDRIFDQGAVMKDETVNPNETARKLLDRMRQDMAMFQRRREAREKIAPLIEQMTDAYYRFPQFGQQGPPTRLHVSPEIWQKLSEYLEEQGKPVASPPEPSIFFLRKPVTAVSDLQGFRWVREPDSWVCGPVHEVR